MAEGNGMDPITRQQGQSVANYWGTVLAAAARGEDVELADKHGNVVAMMISVQRYQELTADD